MSIRVYSYGVHCLTPADQSIVNDQLHHGHRYRNRLTEIERTRRDAYRTLRMSLSPVLASLETQHAECEAAYQVARQALSAVPKAQRDASPQVLVVRGLKQQANHVWTQVQTERRRVETEHFRPYDLQFKTLKDNAKAAHKLIDAHGHCGPHIARRINAEQRAIMMADPNVPDAWKAKDTAQSASEAQATAARSDSQCFPGVYLAVEAASQKSFEESPFMPRFARWDGHGKVGSQITKGLTTEEALACQSSALRIELVALDGHAAHKQRAIVHLRLAGRGEGTSLHLPIILHRPLPPQGDISWVYLVARRVGLRTSYEVQFTVEEPDSRTCPTQTGAIALNLGWRVLRNGDVRVATTYDGVHTTHLTLPASMRRQQSHTESLLGFADEHFNTARETLRQRLLTLDLTPEETETLGLASIAQWRSHGRLARVARFLTERHADLFHTLWTMWRTERLSAHLDLFDTFDVISAWASSAAPGVGASFVLTVYLGFWARKDAHLIQVARDTQKKVVLHRREIYRRYAHGLANTYRNVIFGQWDKRETAELPLPEHDTRGPQEERASGIRQFVGVSVLQQALTHAFGAAFTEVVPSTRVTLDHNHCGGTSSDPLPAIPVTCDTCGQTYDQDVNAARNLFERSSGGQNPPPASNPVIPNEVHVVQVEQIIQLGV